MRASVCAATIAFAEVVTLVSAPRIQAVDTANLVPFVGETVAEFEARRRGRPRPASSGAGAILTADSRGHFLTTAVINGENVKAVIDTGASAVVLPYEDAERIGYRLKSEDFTVAVNTANGKTTAAAIRLKDVQVGDIVVRDVQALVGQPGALGMSLLGMSFLQRLKGFQTQGASMTLQQ
jgi:aspartyl protease family protein